MGSRSILMLEHDDDDQHITRTVFADHGFHIPVTFVTDTDQFSSFLEKCNDHSRPFPSIILINQHCGPMNALDVLKGVKNNLRLRHIPVIILGDVKADSLVKEYYAAGACSFIRKPFTHDTINKSIGNFLAYWFQTVDLV